MILFQQGSVVGRQRKEFKAELMFLIRDCFPFKIRMYHLLQQFFAQKWKMGVGEECKEKTLIERQKYIFQPMEIGIFSYVLHLFTETGYVSKCTIFLFTKKNITQ